jgi:hypothetical protein
VNGDDGRRPPPLLNQHDSGAHAECCCSGASPAQSPVCTVHCVVGADSRTHHNRTHARAAYKRAYGGVRTCHHVRVLAVDGGTAGHVRRGDRTARLRTTTASNDSTTNNESRVCFMNRHPIGHHSTTTFYDNVINENYAPETLKQSFLSVA